MGRYQSYAREKPKPKRGQVHPVMRGIGCILFVLVPILSYMTAILLVSYGAKKGWPIPPDWLGTPTIPRLLLKLQGLAPVYEFIARQTNLTANLIFALVLAVFVFGILAVIYGVMYRLMGPPQYGPTDAPPVRIKVKRYKR